MAANLKDLRSNPEDAYDFGSQPVEVIVGAAQSKFYVHEKLISRAAFFEKALQGDWKEKNERCVRLPEDGPETFKAYLQWIYTGRIPYQPVCQANDSCSVALAKMYVLAEKLLDDEFRDRVIDSLLVTCRHKGDHGRLFPGPGCVKTIYKGTTESSPGRKLLVDMYAAEGNGKWNFAITPTLPTEFLSDVVKSLLQDRPAMTAETRAQKYSELNSGSPCSYHSHDKDKPCTDNLA